MFFCFFHYRSHIRRLLWRNFTNVWGSLCFNDRNFFACWASDLKWWNFTCCYGLATKSCPTLETPWTITCQAPLFIGFPKARKLEWVAISFSKGPFQPRDQTHVSCIAGGFFTTELLRNFTWRWLSPRGGTRALTSTFMSLYNKCRAYHWCVLCRVRWAEFTF